MGIYNVNKIITESYDTNADINKIITSLSSKERDNLLKRPGSIEQSYTTVYEKIEKVDRVVAGYIRLNKPEEGPIYCLEFAIRSEFRHRGLAYNMLKEALESNSKQRFIISHPDNDNIGSQKVVEKAGFKLLERQKYVSIYLYDKKFPNHTAKQIYSSIEGETKD